ncbi:MAG: (d)CMP kinase, partial [Firmicutes bacterium]|nr:(d)CMP kinase [Bacillota bacterium]
LQTGTQIEDVEALAGLLENTTIDIQAGEDRQRIFLDGNEVTEDTRTPGVNAIVSQVSAIPIVREYLVRQQREIARGWGDVVMDGRDIGTAVLPDAEYKIYLDASPEERVRRRWKECIEKGSSITADQVRQEITLRDRIDSGRKVSPLKAAPGAMVLDTTRMTLPEVVSTIVDYVRGEKNG